MIKRFERQIPVTLADDTSSITTEPFDDSYPIGLDRTGTLYAPVGKSGTGVQAFSPVADSKAWISSLLTERGPSKPVTLVVQKGTPFQKSSISRTASKSLASKPSVSASAISPSAPLPPKTDSLK